MHRRTAATGTPPSTHSSVHLLVGHASMPRVSANAVRGAELAPDETVFLHVEAEHRTLTFDHTATFTVSGPRGAIDRLLLLLRAAVASIPPADGADQADPWPPDHSGGPGGRGGPRGPDDPSRN